MHIEIPDGVESLPLLAALEHILYGDGLIDTEDDSGGVEDEEHDDGEDENHREVDIIHLVISSFYNSLTAYIVV